MSRRLRSGKEIKPTADKETKRKAKRKSGKNEKVSAERSAPAAPAVASNGRRTLRFCRDLYLATLSFLADNDLGSLAATCKTCQQQVKEARADLTHKLSSYLTAIIDCARMAAFVDAKDSVLRETKAKAEAKFGGRALLRRVRVLDFTSPPFSGLVHNPFALKTVMRAVVDSAPITTIRVPKDDFGHTFKHVHEELAALRPHSLITASWCLWVTPAQVRNLRRLTTSDSFSREIFQNTVNLRELELTNDTFSQSAAEFAFVVSSLRKSPRLTTLTLSALDYLDDFSIKGLRDCKALTSIDLSSNPNLRGIGLIAISALPSVTRLTLSSLTYPNATSTVDLHGWETCLKKLAPKLKLLDLTNTKVREQDMTSVWPLFRCLSTLCLTGTHCDLLRALPKEHTDVVSEHNRNVLMQDFRASKEGADRALAASDRNLLAAIEWIARHRTETGVLQPEPEPPKPQAVLPPAQTQADLDTNGSGSSTTNTTETAECVIM